MGNNVSEHGLKPDWSKVQAIVDMLPPNDVSSLECLYGLIFITIHSKWVQYHSPNERTFEKENWLAVDKQPQRGIATAKKEHLSSPRHLLFMMLSSLLQYNVTLCKLV